MSVLRALVIDDEPLARARLAALLGECDGVEVAGRFEDAEAAWAACGELRPDVLLLDIDMPGIDGMVLAERAATLARPPQLIFCTAYAEHAARAFDLGAADYVLKPVRLERLREALQRARRLRPKVGPAQGEALVVRLRDEQRRIELDDVIYLSADDKYVTVHHVHGEALTEASLKSLEQAFPRHLLRVHRNCLVALQRLAGLKTLDDGRVVARLNGSEVMPEVSRRNLPQVRRWLG